jgi:signal transduction histidine kinase
VSERQQIRERLEEQLAHETEVADLSRKFMALAGTEIDAAVDEAMAVVGKLARADRSFLFAFDGAPYPIEAAYEWCAEGVEAHGGRVPGASRRRFAWAFQFLGAGKVLQIPSAAELPREAAAERREMLRRGVQSTLGIPLLFGDRLIGYLGFEAVSRRRTWSDESIPILRVAGEILLSALRRKRAEEELLESQLQLLQAQKMEAVGSLAGGIAHDFNNQLTVMLGNARYLKSRLGDDPDLREAIVDLTRSAEHCAALTRSLLAFSRRSAVSAVSLDVAAVVSETRGLIEPLIPSSIRFDLALGDGIAPASADPNQLQQVLVNLVVNARDSMPDGGRIAVTTANRSVGEPEAHRIGLLKPGDYVEIAVCDEGTGMDEQTRQHVFEPFFTTKAVGEGTGLGLATVYGIVQESGGAIELESELGRGTSVRVLLPRAAAEPVKTT